MAGYHFTYEKIELLIHTDYDFTYAHKKWTSESFQEYHNPKICRISEKIPVFDSSDREWNSFKEMLIIKEKNQFSGIYLNGGYHLAQARIYRDLQAGDEETQRLLDILK